MGTSVKWSLLDLLQHWESQGKMKPVDNRLSEENIQIQLTHTIYTCIHMYIIKWCLGTCPCTCTCGYFMPLIAMYVHVTIQRKWEHACDFLCTSAYNTCIYVYTYIYRNTYNLGFIGWMYCMCPCLSTTYTLCIRSANLTHCGFLEFSIATLIPILSNSAENILESISFRTSGDSLAWHNTPMALLA